MGIRIILDDLFQKVFPRRFVETVAHDVQHVWKAREDDMSAVRDSKRLDGRDENAFKGTSESIFRSFKLESKDLYGDQAR